MEQNIFHTIVAGKLDGMQPELNSLYNVLNNSANNGLTRPTSKINPASLNLNGVEANTSENNTWLSRTRMPVQ